MHKLIVFIFVLFFSFWGHTENPEILNIEHSILVYNIIGDYENGIETIYRDGENTCIETDSEINAGTLGWIPYRKKIIITNDYFYDLDLDLKIGKRIPNLVKEYKNFSYEKKQDFYQLVLKTIKPLTDTIKTDKITKSDNTIQYFGKKCDVIETSFFKTYMWNNLLLRQEIFKPFKEIREIKDMQLNVLVNPLVFSVSDNFTVKDVDQNEIQNITNQLNNWLKQSETKKGIK